MIFTIVFWISVLAIFHTYILFPILLRILSHGKRTNDVLFVRQDELPKVSILLSVLDEEIVIQKKLESLASLDYPIEKLEVIIGSDASEDKTDIIVNEFIRKYHHFNFLRFDVRKGKATIINHIVTIAKGELLVITDANILHPPESLFNLVRNFKNNKIGLVDSITISSGINKGGISIQERSYISREARIKHMEGVLWGTLMGPSGGFYALRKVNYHPVPPNFLVDDFYISMKVLEDGKSAISDREAVIMEDVSNDLSEEFRRKVRISAGNFQNLAKFGHLLLNPFKPISFSFLSHKVLRWLGPLFILSALFSNFFLLDKQFYTFSLYTQIVLLIIPFIDIILRNIKIHIVILRFITHFYSMNLAILTGFLWYMKGIKTNVWKPTRRNQSQ